MTNLTDKVARAIQDAHCPGHPINHVAIYQAKAALAVALEEIGEECAKVSDAEQALSIYRSETCSEDMAAEFCFQADYAEALSKQIRARIAEMKAALSINSGAL